jgi:hypothetical protein
LAARLDEAGPPNTEVEEEEGGRGVVGSNVVNRGSLSHRPSRTKGVKIAVQSRDGRPSSMDLCAWKHRKRAAFLPASESTTARQRVGTAKRKDDAALSC